MKKLIAQRPIQYMGRTYESGEAIPAHDPNMVAAWLRANSAAWTGTDLEDPARAADVGVADDVQYLDHARSLPSGSPLRRADRAPRAR